MAYRFMDPIRMNDWGIWNCLRAVLSFQIALMGILVLESGGFAIPLARTLLWSAFVLFIPGVLLLRILRIHALSTPETLLYSVGLSISLLMFLGLGMNVIFPVLGIPEPVAEVPVIVTLNVLVLVLCGLSYWLDREYDKPGIVQMRTVLNGPALFLCLLPFLAVLGTFCVNAYSNNTLLLLLIGVLSLIGVLVAFDAFLPPALYPLAILSVSVSLLLHTSLISLYLWGFDVHYEHFIATRVLSGGFWDMNIPGNVNAVLSIVILAPVLSLVSDMNLTWVFKLVYPLIFALVPLGLYQTFRSQTNAKTAFLAAFFFTTLFTFYAEMPSLGRQEVAELFLVLILMLMVDRTLDPIQNMVLFGIFGGSLAVSHYGLAYLYMMSLVAAWLILKVADAAPVRRVTERVRSLLFRLHLSEPEPDNQAGVSHRSVTIFYVLYIVIFTNIWYNVIADGTAFNTVLGIGENIRRTLIAELFSPAASEGMDLLLNQPVSIIHTIAKYLHLFTLGLITLGVLGILLNFKGIKKKKGIQIEREFAVLSSIFLFLGIAGIAVPYVADSLNTARLYQISLIFLAPYCVIGGVLLFAMLPLASRSSLQRRYGSYPTKILSVLFAVILLFNTGWVYEVTSDHPTSLALSIDQISKNGTALEKSVFYGNYIPEYDIYGSLWLSKQRDSSSPIYADRLRKDNVLSSYGSMDREPPYLTNGSKYLLGESYVFLGYCNIADNIGSGSGGRYSELWSVDENRYLWDSGNTIYSNRYSTIILLPPVPVYR